MTDFRRLAKRGATLALVIGSAMSLQGCYEDDYWARRDTITLGAGDAQAVNAATQTIDPWPEHAKNTEITLEGERARVAIDRYQQNKSLPPRGLNTTEVTGQAGPGAQGSAQIRN